MSYLSDIEWAALCDEEHDSVNIIEIENLHYEDPEEIRLKIKARREQLIYESEHEKLCAACNGSGEGMAPDSVCGECRGRGSML